MLKVTRIELPIGRRETSEYVLSCKAETPSPISYFVDWSFSYSRKCCLSSQPPNPSRVVNSNRLLKYRNAKNASGKSNPILDIAKANKYQPDSGYCATQTHSTQINLQPTAPSLAHPQIPNPIHHYSISSLPPPTSPSLRHLYCIFC